MRFESVLVALVVTDRINSLDAQFGQDVYGQITCQVDFLVCSTLKTCVIRLDSNRVVFSFVIETSVFVINRVGRVITGYALEYGRISYVTILLYAAISGSIQSETYVFVDIRIDIHTGVVTLVVDSVCQTILIRITDRGTVGRLFRTTPDGEVVNLLKARLFECSVIPIRRGKCACPISFDICLAKWHRRIRILIIGRLIK